MTGQAALGIVLVLAGSLLGSPLVVVLGVAAVLFELVRAAWAGRALRGVRYGRRLRADVLVAGDRVPLTVEVWNRQRLPLPWLRADDRASSNASILERELVTVEDFGVALRNTWTLAPRERVARHFTLQANRRGVLELGPVRLEAGDLFARPADEADAAIVQRWLVRPPVVPVAVAPTGEPWGSAVRARRGLLDLQASYAGLREYRPGDPIRRIHPRASARVGRPLVKRFDPARERDVLLVVDVQMVDGPAWRTVFDEDRAEDLCVAAASLAARLLADGAAVGLAVAAYAGSIRPVAFLGPSEAPGQLGRILDTLARLSPFPSAGFEQLLAALSRVLRPGATVLVLTARPATSVAGPMRRLARLGFRPRIVMLDSTREAPAVRGVVADGAAADGDGTLGVRHGAATASAQRVPVDGATVEGGWRTPTAVVLT